jgi:hypothetical protein
MHLKLEQRGLHSELAERLRAEYRERVARRLERASAWEASGSAAGDETVAGTAAATGAARSDVEEIRRRAREAWLQLRSKDRQPSSSPSVEQRQRGLRETREQETEVSPSPQDDLAL